MSQLFMHLKLFCSVFVSEAFCLYVEGKKIDPQLLPLYIRLCFYFIYIKNFRCTNVLVVVFRIFSTVHDDEASTNTKTKI